jgi:L-amino acid N-acyltransferase YncA
MGVGFEYPRLNQEGAMTLTNLGTDVLTALPDLPRWVEARGLLLSHRGFVLDTPDGCRMVCSRSDHLVVPTTIELSPLLESAATREVPGASILIQDVMLPAARYHLPDWTAEAVTLYTLPDVRARAWPVPPWPTAPVSIEQIESAEGLPHDLRAELAAAAAHTPVWGASAEGQLGAFAYAAQTTEHWFDVSVDTLVPLRNRGLGRSVATALIVDHLLRGLHPVWGAVESNEPSHRLARSLGFEAVDMLWLLTRSA